MSNPGKTPRERILNDLNESLNLLWEATPKGEPLFIAGMRRQLDALEALGAERDTLRARVTELEDRAFAEGAMFKAPCFVCGYAGQNYFDSRVHSCAERHHRLWRAWET